MKVMVASPNNTGINNAYVTNAVGFNMYWLGRMGVEATPPLVYDEHPISAARNTICEDALTKHQADYVFMYDGDTVIPPTAIVSLLQHQLPVVSGWYLSRKGSGLPVILKRLTNRPLCSLRNFNNYQSLTLDQLNQLPSPLTPVDAIGAGCLLIATETLKKLKKPLFLEWYDGLAQELGVKNYKGHRFGEDLWFCERVHEAGIKVMLDRRIFCGHWAWTIIDKRYLTP